MQVATNNEYTATTTAASVGVKMPKRRPTTMIAGSISAQKPSITARATSRNEARAGGVRFSLRTTHHQEAHSPAPSISPGTMPARNSFEIETPAATPKITKPMLGGITGAMMPPAATSPAAWDFLWPAATIIGTSSDASAAASAAAEPDNEARMQDARIVT